jgi:hypothetical protein
VIDVVSGPPLDLPWERSARRNPFPARTFIGAVLVIPGTPGGLTGLGSGLWSQNSVGIKGISEVGDTFGDSLAA